MAFVNLKQCLTNPVQLVNLLIVVSCFFVSVYQVARSIEKLMQPPISTYYGFHLNESMRYPAVTICRSLAYKSNLYSKYGIRSRSQSLKQTHFFRHFNFGRFTIAEFLNETTWNFGEIFGSYAYNGNGNSRADVTWTEFQSIDYGRCFTWTARSPSTTFSISGGWWFYLNHDMTRRILDTLGVCQYGFHIFAHHPNEIMTSEYEQENNFLQYLYLEAAEDIRVSLTYDEFTRVNTKDEPCVENDKNYSRSRCMEQCLHEIVVNRINCTLPWLWLLPNTTSYPQCSNLTQVNLVISAFLFHNRRRLVANCTCPMSCKVVVYTPTIIRRKEVTDERQYPDSFIAMYYSNNIVTHMSEMVGYNINTFVSDIGGSVGFLLGLSVISCIAVVEKMLCSIIKTYFRKKNKAKYAPKEEKENEINNVINNNINKMDNEKLDEKEKTQKGDKSNLYENLRDFESNDFKCYEKTLIAETYKF